MARSHKIIRREPLGPWEIGPGKSVYFTSSPLPIPRRTVFLAWGETDLIVRVDSLDETGYAHGIILGSVVREKERLPKGDASVLVERGLGETARRG